MVPKTDIVYLKSNNGTADKNENDCINRRELLDLFLFLTVSSILKAVHIVGFSFLGRR